MSQSMKRKGSDKDTRFREVSIVALNYTVKIKSEYEDDTLDRMKDLAFKILDELKKYGY